jgi:uncharacterized protein (DUF486 family)
MSFIASPPPDSAHHIDADRAQKAQLRKFAKYRPKHHCELQICEDVVPSEPLGHAGEPQIESPHAAIPVPVLIIGLRLVSNNFMTFAWYGQLKCPSAPLAAVILVILSIDLFEYGLMVPANRIRHTQFARAELKTIHEVITLSVFAAFSVVYLKEPLTWNHLVGFAFIGCRAFFIFHKWA